MNKEQFITDVVDKFNFVEPQQTEIDSFIDSICGYDGEELKDILLHIIDEIMPSPLESEDDTVKASKIKDTVKELSDNPKIMDMFMEIASAAK